MEIQPPEEGKMTMLCMFKDNNRTYENFKRRRDENKRRDPNLSTDRRKERKKTFHPRSRN